MNVSLPVLYNGPNCSTSNIDFGWKMANANSHLLVTMRRIIRSQWWLQAGLSISFHRARPLRLSLENDVSNNWTNRRRALPFFCRIFQMNVNLTTCIESRDQLIKRSSAFSTPGRDDVRNVLRNTALSATKVE